MTVYEIPNIEHCNVELFSTLGYRITAHEGWYIHLNNGVEDTQNVWKTVVILWNNYDFSTVEIRSEADLPPDAEICGDTEQEVM